jgi:hypothetical protein
MNNRLSFYAILFLTIIFYGCNPNPLDVNIKDEKLPIKYINVDQQLYGQPLDKLKSNVQSFKEQLGDLFIYELSQNIRQQINDTSYHAIFSFYNSDYISEIEESKNNLYAKLPAHQDKMNTAFNYLSFHFSDSILPKNIFYINKLFSQVACTNTNIAIGLENYLPPESDVISSIPNEKLYQWQRARMNIEFLERDVLLNWIQVQLFDELDGKLAEHIIQAGKILYVLNATFPKSDEAYILRYNEEQYKWARENERSVWNYLVRQQLLFKTDLRVRTNFLNEGPSTIGLDEKSPDRIGQFLGYRIVKGYMSKNKALSLQELLEKKYNIILQTYEIQ